MIDFQKIKKVINPLNAVITCIIVLFICIRVLSNNYENAFVLEAIVTTEPIVELQSEQLTKQQTETQTEPQTEQQTTIEQIVQSDKATSESLAYSAELGKTFTIEAFNKLSKEELMTFSGIGEVTAQAILDYIKENGPFSRFEDLMDVKGIGEKKLQKIMTILP